MSISTTLFAGGHYKIFSSMSPEGMKNPTSDYLKAEDEKLFSGKGEFSAKTAQLIGLAASAGMKCEYCILAHTAAAKKAGATDEEIKSALLIANGIALKSSMLYGSRMSMDHPMFKQMKKALE